MSNFSPSDRFCFSSDTLSLINKYSGSTFVIKYGGSAMKSDSLKLSIVQDISLLYLLGIKIVLVHGGGFLIDQWLNKLSIQPKFHNGLRVTDAQTMELVEMVLSGNINKNLVSLFNKYDVNSIGLSGKDSNFITAVPISNDLNNFTGKVDKINPFLLHTLLSNNIFPIIASIAPDLQGLTYNINADTLASSVASSLHAEKLILITDTPGLLSNVNDTSSLIKHLTLDQLNALTKKNIIKDGMIPKVNACVEALHNNVSSSHIIDGRVKHSLLYEILTYDRLGSMFVS